MAAATNDGPSLEQYIETRLNLLTKLVADADDALGARIEALELLRVAADRAMRAELSHMGDLFHSVQEGAKRAVDKAEASQLAHNLAANEWRATVTDFRSNTASRQEFDRFYAEFSAYRLEASTKAGQIVGQAAGVKEHKEGSLALFGLVAAAVSVAIALLNRLLG